MKSASNSLPDQPINDVSAGIDWARDDHAVDIVEGQRVLAQQVPTPETEAA